MKFITIIIFKLLLFKIAYSEDYSLEIYFTNKTEPMILSEDSKYLHIVSKGVWKDSYGDYGSIKCLGGVIQNRKSTSLDAYCEAINQDKLKFWLKLKRDSDRDAGVGSSLYINGEKKYKEFIGKNCVYASKVFGVNAIVNQKCKINNKNK